VPRIRSIKPSFWSDDAVADLSRDARLLLIGLISFADDDGRFLASISAIAGYVFPHDDMPAAKIKRWLDEIAAVGIVVLYTVKDRDYGYFPHYRDHQRISKPQPSPLPHPMNGQVQSRSSPDRGTVPQASAESFRT
jgi:hypothetical protein